MEVNATSAYDVDYTKLAGVKIAEDCLAVFCRQSSYRCGASRQCAFTGVLQTSLSTHDLRGRYQQAMEYMQLPSRLQIVLWLDSLKLFLLLISFQPRNTHLEEVQV